MVCKISDLFFAVTITDGPKTPVKICHYVFLKNFGTL
jgi:hypothetical protein